MDDVERVEEVDGGEHVYELCRHGGLDGDGPIPIDPWLAVLEVGGVKLAPGGELLDNIDGGVCAEEGVIGEDVAVGIWRQAADDVDLCVVVCGGGGDREDLVDSVDLAGLGDDLDGDAAATGPTVSRIGRRFRPDYRGELPVSKDCLGPVIRKVAGGLRHHC